MVVAWGLNNLCQLGLDNGTSERRRLPAGLRLQAQRGAQRRPAPALLANAGRARAALLQSLSCWAACRPLQACARPLTGHLGAAGEADVEAGIAAIAAAGAAGPAAPAAAKGGASGAGAAVIAEWRPVLAEALADLKVCAPARQLLRWPAWAAQARAGWQGQLARRAAAQSPQLQPAPPAGVSFTSACFCCPSSPPGGGHCGRREAHGGADQAGRHVQLRGADVRHAGLPRRRPQLERAAAVGRAARAAQRGP
jgi:hypothetical protein